MKMVQLQQGRVSSNGSRQFWQR